MDSGKTEVVIDTIDGVYFFQSIGGIVTELDLRNPVSMLEQILGNDIDKNRKVGLKIAVSAEDVLKLMPLYSEAVSAYNQRRESEAKRALPYVSDLLICSQDELAEQA